MRVRKVLEETKLGNILFFFFQKWNCRKSDFQGSKSQPLSAAFVYKETEKKKEEEEEEGGRVGGWLGGLTGRLPHISPGNTFGFNYFVPLGNKLL